MFIVKQYSLYSINVIMICLYSISRNVSVAMTVAVSYARPFNILPVYKDRHVSRECYEHFNTTRVFRRRCCCMSKQLLIVLFPGR